MLYPADGMWVSQNTLSRVVDILWAANPSMKCRMRCQSLKVLNIDLSSLALLSRLSARERVSRGCLAASLAMSCSAQEVRLRHAKLVVEQRNPLEGPMAANSECGTRLCVHVCVCVLVALFHGPKTKGPAVPHPTLNRIP